MTKIDENDELVAPDGTKAGDHIKGSRFVRAFCQHCEEPIRVPVEGILTSYCNQCEPSHKSYKPTTNEPEKGLRHLKDYNGDPFEERGNR
jgi:hypothetical protein